MAEVILMPRLSDTMTEGVIADWHKQVGDTVKKGDLLAEIETDKATMELESYQDGVLLHIGPKKGEKLAVNGLLAILGKAGENIDAVLQEHGGGANTDTPPTKTDNTKRPDAPHASDAPTPTTASKATDADSATAAQNTATAKDAAPQNKTAAAPATSAEPALDLSKSEAAILMPRLSDTMTEGVIAEWHKKIGDTVKKGDILAEVETDKATMELESYKDGKMLYIGVDKGGKIPVNALLCIVGDDSTDVDAIVAAAKTTGEGKATTATGNNAATSAEAPASTEAGADSNNAKTDTTASKAAVPATGTGPSDNSANTPAIVNEGRIFASPLAKKLAEEKGVDLRYVAGTGDNGRITKSDVENYKAPVSGTSNNTAATENATTAAANTNPPAAAKPAATAPASGTSFEDRPVSQMRKVIARRLSESLFTAPHFYLTMAIDMDAAIATRVKLNELSPVKISFNDLVLKACAVALKQHPAINSSWMGDTIRTNHHINIGVAVAVDEGLLVPVVRNADQKSLSTIGTEVKEFAKKAKDKKLQPAEWEGSTFTISNLGMFGIDEFTAIINSPDACILAVGGISPTPVVKNGAVVPGNIMKVTLSCDHRVVDGATGAAFLQTLKGLLEEPLRMLV